MSAEQSILSRMRELYARSSSTAPKERLYRQLKDSEMSDLIAMLEPSENPEAAELEGVSHFIRRSTSSS